MGGRTGGHAVRPSVVGIGYSSNPISFRLPESGASCQMTLRCGIKAAGVAPKKGRVYYYRLSNLAQYADCDVAGRRRDGLFV